MGHAISRKSKYRSFLKSMEKVYQTSYEIQEADDGNFSPVEKNVQVCLQRNISIILYLIWLYLQVGIIWGTKDPILGRAFKRMKELFPNTVAVVETDGGHFLQEEHPEKIASVIAKVTYENLNK
jgi:pimeloyl-ACP methyl ester carboxylesterase